MALRGGPTARITGAILGAIAVVAVMATSCKGAGSKDTTGDEGSSGSTVLTPNKSGGVVTGPADKAPIEGGQIRFAIEAEPEGLDPTRYAFSQAGNTVASAVFDPLATLDKDGNVVPYLATGFDHNDDYTVWTIGLPSGVTFHDGTPLTADVVVQVLEAYRASLITGPSVKGIVTSVATKDPTHVEVKTAFPYRYVPGAMASQIGYIFAPSMLTNPDLAKKPIGTGPFIIDQHEDGRFWKFKKNPGYWRKGLPHLNAIEFDPIAEDADRLQKLDKGDVDMIHTIAGQQFAELRNMKDLKLVENRFGDKAFLMLNTTKPPFDNVTARRAVAYATDSAKWRKDMYADVATPANSPYGPNQPGYLTDNGFPQFNPAKAKELVAQYKQETGNELEFTFLASADVNNARDAQLFAPAFEAAGMKVKIVQRPQINLLGQVAAGDYQLSQFRLFSNPSPIVDATFYRSAAIQAISLNFPRYGNPEIDQAVEKAAGTDDRIKQDPDFQRISRIFAEQVPYVWLGQLTWALAANERVNGVAGAANGTVPTLMPRTWIAELSLSS